MWDLFPVGFLLPMWGRKGWLLLTPRSFISLGIYFAASRKGERVDGGCRERGWRTARGAPGGAEPLLSSFLQGPEPRGCSRCGEFSFDVAGDEIQR